MNSLRYPFPSPHLPKSYKGSNLSTVYSLKHTLLFSSQIDVSLPLTQHLVSASLIWSLVNAALYWCYFFFFFLIFECVMYVP